MVAQRDRAGASRFSWSSGIRVELRQKGNPARYLPCSEPKLYISDVCIAVSTYFFISFGFPLNFSKVLF